MLDSFDVMLYALVLASLMTDLGHRQADGRACSARSRCSPPPPAACCFGVIADRFGRTRALMGSVLIYSVFTAACGLSQNAAQLAVFRICLGIGMGGEWASGAALVSETWPREHRGKALGLMQSAWAIGYGAAALVTWLVLPRCGLARRVLRRRPAGALHACGSAATSRSRRSGRRGRRRPRAVRLQAALRAGHAPVSRSRSR